LLKTARRAALALTTAGALVVGLSGQVAHALPPSNGAHEVLALGGSETTQDVMEQISTDFKGNATFNPANPAKDAAVNMPSLLPPAAEFTVNGDGNCGTVTYSSDRPVPPGDQHLPRDSFEGLNTLQNDTMGCIDIARSSSDENPGGLDMFAFAKDTVSWAGFRSLNCPGSSIPCSPGNLTQQNLKDIFLCTTPDPNNPGMFKPVDRKWSQVNPSLPAVKIQRVLPQQGGF
jgi:ABC-type phosphate transport system substrate-binding protein